MKTHTRTKEMRAAKRRVRDDFYCQCVICDAPSKLCAHILTAGSHKELAHLTEVMVILCVPHDRIMEKLKDKERPGWLLAQVFTFNHSMYERIHEQLVTLSRSYTRLRGGILTIE